jgi:hypothetical protein
MNQHHSQTANMPMGALIEKIQGSPDPTPEAPDTPIELEGVLDAPHPPTPESEQPGPEPEPAPTKTKAKRKRAPRTTIPTSSPEIELELRTHKPGPKKRRVVVYKEDIPRDEITIVEKSRTKGRPAKGPKITRVQDGEPEPVTQVGPDVIQYHRPSPQVELTAKQLKHLELAQQFATLEQAAGRKLRQTTKGKVDKRCIVERTPKQILSAKRLVDANKLRRLEKQIAERAKTATTVREVIGELATASRTAEVVEVQEEEVVLPPKKTLRTRDMFSN